MDLGQRLGIVGLVCLALLTSLEGAESPLRYQSGKAIGKLHEATPGLPAGVTSSQLIDELSSSPAKFAYFDFGIERPPLVIAKMEVDSESILLADINGDLRLGQDERLPENNQQWTIELRTDPGRAESLQTLFLSVEDDRFSIAQGGYLEGRVKIDDRTVATRVLDGDANGRFSDSIDRLLLDLDDNGKFSSLRERFASHGVLRIGGRRYTIGFSSDERSISLLPLTGTGYVIPKIPLADESATIVDFEVELASTGGVHVSLNRLDSATEIPVGIYHVERLRFEIHSERKWKMAFAKNSGKNSTAGVAVLQGETVELDLLGKLTLKASIVHGSLASRGSVSVQPSLDTSTGLYLRGCSVGDITPQDDNRLTATLFDLRGNSDRDVLAVEGTGFGCGNFCPITFDKNQRVGPSSMVMLQFDSGPLVGKMIRTTGVTRPQSAPINDELELP